MKHLLIAVAMLAAMGSTHSQEVIYAARAGAPSTTEHWRFCKDQYERRNQLQSECMQYYLTPVVHKTTVDDAMNSINYTGKLYPIDHGIKLLVDSGKVKHMMLFYQGKLVMDVASE